MSISLFCRLSNQMYENVGNQVRQVVADRASLSPVARHGGGGFDSGPEKPLVPMRAVTAL
jgi:hypothetical protein